MHVVAGAATGRVLELDANQVVTVGRASDAHLCVAEDTALSRQHMQLELAGARLRAKDLQSRHGMYVNGQRTAEVDLNSGDRVQAGETILQVELIHDELPPTLPPVAQTARGWGAKREDADSLMRGVAAAPARKPPLVEVRCRCGVLASNEPARPGEEDVVFLCNNCQNKYADKPVLPAGYEFVRVLGRGAMGCVYLASQLATGELRAIKQILPKAAMSIDMRKMFVREAAVQAVLAHEHIVRVFELVEPMPGSFSIIMEYVEGTSADQLIEGGATTPPALAVAIGMQALAGLAHAHAKAIVHRDIKEANLMLVRKPDGSVTTKITDFGLAKNFHESGASGVTGDGALGGTLPYMSKEQLLDYKYVKPPTDIYALGVTMYRLLTGEYPRDYRDGDNWIRISLEQPIVPLRKRVRGSNLPPALCTVVEKALEPEVKKRHRSAEDMRKALAALAI